MRACQSGFDLTAARFDATHARWVINIAEAGARRPLYYIATDAHPTLNALTLSRSSPPREANKGKESLVRT